MASSEKQSGGVYNAAAVSPKDTRGKRYETMPEYKAAKKHDPYKADEEKDWVILDPEEPRYTHFHKEEGTGKFGVRIGSWRQDLFTADCTITVPCNCDRGLRPKNEDRKTPSKENEKQ